MNSMKRICTGSERGCPQPQHVRTRMGRNRFQALPAIVAAAAEDSRAPAPNLQLCAPMCAYLRVIAGKK